MSKFKIVKEEDTNINPSMMSYLERYSKIRTNNLSKSSVLYILGNGDLNYLTNSIMQNVNIEAVSYYVENNGVSSIVIDDKPIVNEPSLNVLIIMLESDMGDGYIFIPCSQDKLTKEDMNEIVALVNETYYKSVKVDTINVMKQLCPYPTTQLSDSILDDFTPLTEAKIDMEMLSILMFSNKDTLKGIIESCTSISGHYTVTVGLPDDIPLELSNSDIRYNRIEYKTKNVYERELEVLFLIKYIGREYLVRYTNTDMLIMLNNEYVNKEDLILSSLKSVKHTGE